jgi:hypothetical protein
VPVESKTLRKDQVRGSGTPKKTAVRALKDSLALARQVDVAKLVNRIHEPPMCVGYVLEAARKKANWARWLAAVATGKLPTVFERDDTRAIARQAGATWDRECWLGLRWLASDEHWQRLARCASPSCSRWFFKTDGRMKFCAPSCKQRARPAVKRDRAVYMQNYREVVKERSLRVTTRKKSSREKIRK